MVVGGSQLETLNTGFVLLGTRQQGVPVARSPGSAVDTILHILKYERSDQQISSYSFVIIKSKMCDLFHTRMILISDYYGNKRFLFYTLEISLLLFLVFFRSN
ncbi:unnamed protein product [Schistosoma margrebowiei]|uniref:Uncharacterized protein n=1 Tax=Schistosoma margrebowiei TaxID=48269 RepID=A0A183MPU9_9TREM|nr:unnamed protein product [Schistosoma margrebowiei]